MDNADVATHLENLDHRVDRIEQILPTLATKDDLQRAIEPLATKADLVATEEKLRREIREEGERSRLHMDIVAEDLKADIQLLATHAASQSTKPPER